MHERSLVAAVLAKVKNVAKEQGAVRVRDICLEIGPLSGVEPLLLHSAFTERAEEEFFAGATLTIVTAPLTASCRACGNALVIEQFRFRCSGCGSQNLQVTGGDDVKILSMTIEEASPAG